MLSAHTESEFFSDIKLRRSRRAAALINHPNIYHLAWDIAIATVNTANGWWSQHVARELANERPTGWLPPALAAKLMFVSRLSSLASVLLCDAKTFIAVFA
ncbi:unnamed protein product [Ceratitis capitata]|uniref:(Mediterranean fruit fly) hypothetical protein n=1 Tax=Ceratitis capitata TaxID=7213 RepID=A0A811V6I1_CERCA|nr:unnamed protein product [Ceratitis capitata]